MSQIIDYSAEDICKVMGYNNGNPFVSKAPLLPAAYIDFSAVNGDSDTLIFFKYESPLLKMAQIKKRLISYDATLFDMLEYNNPMNIAAKNYNMLRIQEIILHNQLTPTIAFFDEFKKLRIENFNNKTKMDVRNITITFFAELTKAAARSCTLPSRLNHAEDRLPPDSADINCYYRNVTTTINELSMTVTFQKNLHEQFRMLIKSKVMSISNFFVLSFLSRENFWFGTTTTVAQEAQCTSFFEKRIKAYVIFNP